MEKESEFGKGGVYNLGLFLAHAERYSELREKKDNLFASMWFNGSSDHLYELEIPEKFPEDLKKRLKVFQRKVLDMGHGIKSMSDNVTEEEVTWSINEAKELLFAIDIFLGLNPKKGEYE